MGRQEVGGLAGVQGGVLGGESGVTGVEAVDGLCRRRLLHSALKDAVAGVSLREA